jgi:hypothetical protein
MLIVLQLLFGLRGVNRMVWASSPSDLPLPSIHPKQSAWSTDSDQVMLGLPAFFL